MIEIFELLRSANTIGGINVSDLNELFLNNNKTLYEISLIKKDSVILKNKETNAFEKLNCVCDYFDTNGNKDCIDIKKQLSTNDLICSSCVDCYKCALRRLEAGDITLK